MALLDRAPAALPAPTETGALGVYQLKRYWAHMRAAMRGEPVSLSGVDRQADSLVLHAVGIGLEQAAEYLACTAASFEDLEHWIATTTGGVAPAQVARINAAIAGRPCPTETARWLAAIDAAEPVLSDDDLAFWHTHGYVVLHDAVPAESRDAAAQALWDHLGASADDADTWYRPSDHGIMVQYFQHPAFEANRRSPRLHKAFAQLWGSADLWVTTDRVGFNPPERPHAPFRGPHMHWDVSVKPPIPFGTQGILYLTDTAPTQGALTVVPGFHRWGEQWLQSLPPGADPRRQNLHALGSTPIGGRAGDLIIWHQALPHGPSPNRATRPRLVQYINMGPARCAVQDEWL